MESADKMVELAEALALEAIKQGLIVKISVEPLIDTQKVFNSQSTTMLQDMQQVLMRVIEKQVQE